MVSHFGKYGERGLPLRALKLRLVEPRRFLVAYLNAGTGQRSNQQIARRDIPDQRSESAVLPRREKPRRGTESRASSATVAGDPKRANVPYGLEKDINACSHMKLLNTPGPYLQ